MKDYNRLALHGSSDIFLGYNMEEPQVAVFGDECRKFN